MKCHPVIGVELQIWPASVCFLTMLKKNNNNTTILLDVKNLTAVSVAQVETCTDDLDPSASSTPCVSSRCFLVTANAT